MTTSETNQLLQIACSLNKSCVTCITSEIIFSDLYALKLVFTVESKDLRLLKIVQNLQPIIRYINLAASNSSKTYASVRHAATNKSISVDRVS